MDVFIIILAISLLAIFFAGLNAMRVMKYPAGSKEMIKIASAIRKGAMAFLIREYKALILFVITVFLILLYFIGTKTALTFIAGAICSGLAGFIGMNVAVRANVRTTQAARTNLGTALRIAFSSGSVMGLIVVGLGLLGITSLFLLMGTGAEGHESAIFGFAFGASSIALFARVGGGIYTKAADVGADLVGKVEKGIPEDDPRNPAVIADNVGDNVGDVAGMGADLFESFVNSLLASIVIGFLAFGVKGVALPLSIAASGIIASILGSFFVRTKKEKNIYSSLRTALFISSGMVILAAYFLSNYFGMGNIFWAIIAGLVMGVILGLITEYYTSYQNKPVKTLAKSAKTGSATTIIQGLAIGMESTALPLILIAAAIIFSFHIGGLFGIAMAAVGMLSTLGISLAIDAYGPVADNAGGIAEMAKLPSKVRERTDALDAVGNTTAAMGKGFAIGAAALAALSLFATYTKIIDKTVVLTDPKIIAGLFIGGMLPFLFSSLSMRAVGKTAFKMIEEVRRQFRTIKGIMRGTAEPEYAKCVDIATKGALVNMVLPGLITISAPIIIGLLLGPEAVAGLLAGTLASGVVMAIMMANAGGAWDNAKKYIEMGNLGGKGSETHKAAVVGDTVGDPFKDTSGPSLNILINVMTIVSLTFLPLFL